MLSRRGAHDGVLARQAERVVSCGGVATRRRAALVAVDSLKCRRFRFSGQCIHVSRRVVMIACHRFRLWSLFREQLRLGAAYRRKFTLRGPQLLTCLRELVAPRFGYLFLPKALISVLLDLSQHETDYTARVAFCRRTRLRVCVLAALRDSKTRKRNRGLNSHLARVAQHDGTGGHVGGAQGGERKHGPQGYRLRLGVPRCPAGSAFSVARWVGAEVYNIVVTSKAGTGESENIS